MFLVLFPNIFIVSRVATVVFKNIEDIYPVFINSPHADI